jgi:hypothetical protein
MGRGRELGVAVASEFAQENEYWRSWVQRKVLPGFKYTVGQNNADGLSGRAATSTSVEVEDLFLTETKRAFRLLQFCKTC